MASAAEQEIVGRSAGKDLLLQPGTLLNKRIYRIAALLVVHLQLSAGASPSFSYPCSVSYSRVLEGATAHTVMFFAGVFSIKRRLRTAHLPVKAEELCVERHCFISCKNYFCHRQVGSGTLSGMHRTGMMPLVKSEADARSLR